MSVPISIMLAGLIVGIATIDIKTLTPPWLWVGSGIVAIYLIGILRSTIIQEQVNPRVVLKSLIIGFTIIFAHGYATWYLQKALQHRVMQPMDVTATVLVRDISDGVREHWRQRVQVIQSDSVFIGPQQWLLYAPGYNNNNLTPIPDMRPGQVWKVHLRQRPPHGLASPGAFDQEKWLLEQEVTGTGLVESAQLDLVKTLDYSQRLNGLSSIYIQIQVMRLDIREHFQAFDHNSRGVLLGLLTGDRSLITPDTTQLYQRMGISHLLAISGPHVLFAAIMVTWFLRQLMNRVPRIYLWAERPRWLLPIFCCIVVFYACLAGFDIPAQRTVVMVLVSSTFLWWRRRHDQLNVLMLTASILLIFKPLAVLSAAFWLSFGAVAILISMYQPVTAGSQMHHSWVATGKQFVFSFIQMQWRLFILLTPLVLICFQAVSLLSPVINLLAIPFLTLIIVPLNLLGWVFYQFNPYWADVIWHALLSLLDYFHSFLFWMHDIFPTALQPMHLGFVAAVGLLLATGLLLLPSGLFPRWWCAFLIIPVYWQMQPNPPLLMQVLDVGQGLSVIIKTKHHAMLVDTGAKLPDQAEGMGERVVLPALSALGIKRLDKLMLTHLDNDHSGGAAAVLANMPVAQLTSSEEFPDHHTYLCEAGQQWWWDGVLFEVLSPTDALRQQAEANDASCVLRVSTLPQAGLPAQRLLITGDAGFYPEYLLLNEQVDIQADLLVLGHHGSRFSSSNAFLTAVEPKRAIVSAGYLNRYHHPAPVVLARLKEQGIQVDSTIQDGALTYLLGVNQVITPERYRDRHMWLKTFE